MTIIQKVKSMETGIFCRGILLGVMDKPYSYVDKKSGEVKSGVAHLLGLERNYRGSFGEERAITEALRIPEELYKNAAFIGSITPAIGAMVEVPLSGYQDYPDRRHFITKEAKITVCGNEKLTRVA